jgi:hypothetical protein
MVSKNVGKPTISVRHLHAEQVQHFVIRIKLKLMCNHIRYPVNTTTHIVFAASPNNVNTMWLAHITEHQGTPPSGGHQKYRLECGCK